jgi:alcohol dehydrogenase YqhD (iron-dependent ADH family)
MDNFIAYNPVKIHFGKGIIQNLGSTASGYGNRILLITGKSSVKKTGIFDQVMKVLTDSGLSVWEYSGIKPNPVIEDVRAAAELGIRQQVNMVIGLGGGSVIDSAKIIAASIAENADGWDIMTRKHRMERALPLIAILTLAATGTEMNQFAVVQNAATREKIGYGHPELYPRHSFLDPEFTTSVDAKNTAYGIVDLMAHSMESYFGSGEAPLADGFVFAILKEAVQIADPLLNDPQNYELRARMMWAATNALNGYPAYGRKMGDWAVHGLGHPISLLFDTPHGATLSIIYPAWMQYLSKKTPERIAQLGLAVFGTNDPQETIEAFKNFFSRLGAPVSLSDAGIESTQRNELLKLWKEKRSRGNLYELEDTDYEFLLSLI